MRTRPWFAAAAVAVLLLTHAATARPPEHPASRAPAKAGLLLDGLTTHPRFAGWTGGRWSSTYAGPVIRIRRVSDGALRDVNATGADRTNLGTVASHCGGTVCTLAVLFDQSGNGYDLTAQSDSQQPVVYSEAPLGALGANITHTGGPVLGSTGYLGAFFDGGGADADDVLLRDDTLGLVGDVALNMVGDVNPAGVDSYQFLAQIGDGSPGTGPLDSLGMVGYLFEPAYGASWFPEVDYDGDYPVKYYATVPSSTLPGWQQVSREAGDLPSQAVVRWKGAQWATVQDGGNPQATMALDPPGTTRFSWGNVYWPYWATHGDSPFNAVNGVVSNLALWNAGALPAPDQAAVDAWEAAHHS